MNDRVVRKTRRVRVRSQDTDDAEFELELGSPPMMELEMAFATSQLGRVAASSSERLHDDEGDSPKLRPRRAKFTPWRRSSRLNRDDERQRCKGLADLLDAFEEDGLLIHNIQRNSNWQNKLAVATTLGELDFDTDCGAHCIALSLLHPQLPVQVYCPNCATLVFRAGADLWRHVQCAAVTDSNSGNRACCACYEPQWCPFDGVDQHDSGYCASACADPTDATCQALAAGCGFNLRDIGNDAFGTRKCSENEVKGGTCELCMQPAWCDDGGMLRANGSFVSPYGRPIDTVNRWLSQMEEGGSWLQDHQCKFRASQKDAFVATAHAHMRNQKLQGYLNGFAWNEVNFYSDGGIGDGGLSATMLRNLVGVVKIQENGHNPDHEQIREITKELKRLGVTVPTLTLHIGGKNNLDEWDPTRSVNLRGTYELQEL